MKASVAITLIITGTILILAPYISTAVGTAQATQAMVELSRDVNLRANMPRYYDTVCLIAGVVMILAGVMGACKSSS